MARSRIGATNLRIDAINLWLNRWCLLTSGDKNNHNTMTIGWGSIGTMWSKPFIQVVVRPQRYTYEFMEKYSTFTVSVLPLQYREAMQILGSKSGRDSDKVKESGLTVVNSEIVEAPAFKEAELVFECKKNYWQDMDSSHFLDNAILDKYAAKDYHRIYFGEILAVYGESYYKA